MRYLGTKNRFRSLYKCKKNRSLLMTNNTWLYYLQFKGVKLMTSISSSIGLRHNFNRHLVKEGCYSHHIGGLTNYTIYLCRFVQLIKGKTWKIIIKFDCLNY